MSIRESSLSWSGVMVVEVTGRASCLGGAAAVHTSLTCQTGLDKRQWNRVLARIKKPNGYLSPITTALSV